MNHSWQQLSAQDALCFLDAVRSEEFRVLFEPSICEVYKHPLPFYEGYDLIRIVNKYSPPFVLIDYISNGENHYYLNGSDHVMQTLCLQGNLSLNADNVLEYIDLYFSYVYERGNTVVLLPESANADVHYDQSIGVYVIRTVLLYQDERREMLIHVHAGGRIDLIEPARISFLDAPKGFKEIDHTHPKAESILEQCKSLLAKSATGARLLEVAQTCKIEMSVLASPNIQARAYNKPMVHLYLPAAQHTADYHQALTLAGALSDVEQILRGYKRPSLDEGDEVYLSVNYDKNLKLLVEICKIVEELEDNNDADAVKALENLDLGKLYVAYKNGDNAAKLMTVYLETLIDLGYVHEGK